MCKYLITGGNGFVGKNLINYIKERDNGDEIIAITSREPSNQMEGCRYVICNVEETEKYNIFIDNNTIIVHLAWCGFPNTKCGDVSKGIHNNIACSCKLFKTAVDREARCIVFLSSGGGIYGKPQNIPIKESHSTIPLSYYGVEKLAVENYLRLITSETLTQAVILRPSNPYGRFQKPFTGQGVISTFLASALLDRPVDVWGNGSAVRDYFYIDDLSSAIVQTSLLSEKYIVVNVGSNTGISIKDIINTIERVVGKSLLINYLSTTTAETGANVLDCTVAHEKLNWNPMYSLEDGIDIMLSTWNPSNRQFERRPEVL